MPPLLKFNVIKSPPRGFRPRFLLPGLAVFLTLIFFSNSILAAPPFEEFLKIKSSDPNIQIQAFPSPDEVRPGDQFQIYVRVTIGEDWHIYAMENQDQEESLSTQIHFSESAFKSEGQWKETSPRLEMDEVLEKAVKIHKGQVEFNRLHSVPADLKPGVYSLSGILLFRACDNKVCSLPREISFKTQVEILGNS